MSFKGLQLGPRHLAILVLAMLLAVGVAGAVLGDDQGGVDPATKRDDDTEWQLTTDGDDDDLGDGDDTEGDDATNGGAHADDGDDTEGDDATNGGANTGDGDDTDGDDGTNGGANTGDGDDTDGDDGTNGGDNSEVAPAPAPAGDTVSDHGGAAPAPADHAGDDDTFDDGTADLDEDTDH